MKSIKRKGKSRDVIRILAVPIAVACIMQFSQPTTVGATSFHNKIKDRGPMNYVVGLRVLGNSNRSLNTITTLGADLIPADTKGRSLGADLITSDTRGESRVPDKSKIKSLEPMGLREDYVYGEKGTESIKEIEVPPEELWNQQVGSKVSDIVKEAEEQRERQRIAEEKIKTERVNALKDKIKVEEDRRQKSIEQRDKIIQEEIEMYDTRYEEINRNQNTASSTDFSEILGGKDIFIIGQALKGEPNETLNKNIFNMMPDYLGKPYVWGGDEGTTKGKSYDCSGFTLSVLNRLGYNKLPRVSRDQFKVGKEIPISDLQPGDLVFFDTKYSPSSPKTQISHVGLYVGKGMMVHASSGSNRVKTEQVFSNYFAPRYKGARRYLY